MRKLWMVALAGALSLLPALAQHEGHHGSSPSRQSAPTTTVVFKVSGLHCQPCADAVTANLKRSPGIGTVQVSLEEEVAVVTYQSGVTDVQQLAHAVAQTRSPMPRTRFSAALLLDAGKLRDKDAIRRLETALKGIKGVNKVESRPIGGVVIVTFAERPQVHLADLIGAAEKAGFTVSPLIPGEISRLGTDKQGHGKHDGASRSNHGCCDM